MPPCEIERCKCKWKDIQLFSGSFHGEIQLDGNINKDKQKVRCQEVGQRRDKDVKWRLRWRCTKTFSINRRNQKIAGKVENVKVHKSELLGGISIRVGAVVSLMGGKEKEKHQGSRLRN